MGKAVRIADIKDNIERTRMLRLNREARERLSAKYLAALQQLGAV